MHRTDGDSHVSNLFVDGDPNVPTVGTQVEKHWLNAVQEEIVGVILDASIALVKDTNTQLLTALRSLFVRATGAATQTITGTKNFTGLVTMIKAAGAAAANLRIENLETSNDSNAIYATSTSVGVTVEARNTSSGTAVNAVSTDGQAVRCVSKISSPTKSPLHILPQDNAPSVGVKGDLYVDSTTGKLYIYTTSWVLVGTQS